MFNARPNNPANNSRREQFRTYLKCGRCGAVGHAVWEENGAPSQDGPMGALVGISGPFVQRASHNLQGQPEIACTNCGQTHPD